MAPWSWSNGRVSGSARRLAYRSPRCSSSRQARSSLRRSPRTATRKDRPVKPKTDALQASSLLSTWAIVVAAGDGVRLGADRPKAFVKLGGRLLLSNSVELFEAHPAVDGVVLVVPEGWEEPATLLADDLVAGK